MLLAASGIAIASVYFLHGTRPVHHTSAERDEESSASPAPYEARHDWPVNEGQRLLTGPTVQAPPSPEVGQPISHMGTTDAKVEVAEVMARLQASGPSTGQFDAKVTSVFDTLKHDLPADSKVQFGAPQCFADGCSVVARYPDAGTYLDVALAYERSKAFSMWTGPKFRSGPITTSSGQIEATWALFN